MSREPTGRDHRRQEARAIPWGELIPQHRAAVRRVLELLRSAVAALPEPKREAPADPIGVASALRVRPDRTSQLAFIDGGRGTGKTSVELSLRDALLSPEGLKRMRGGVVSAEHKAEIEALASISEDIRPHLEWLIPLDMEPLPAGVNVLAAILVRIEQTLRDIIGPDRGSPAGWLADSDRGDELMTTLDSLRTDVVCAWDGGMRERSPGQNLHAWSQEVLDAERARLNLVERLTFLLDRIAWHRHQRGGKSPLFVLVVDDFDLSPSHCVELLRVVRMIATPRLFFIFAGHLDMAQDVMHLKSAGDASTLAGFAGKLPSCASRVEQMARGVAANNLRKLVPPAHRIELGPLGADDLSQVYLAPPKDDTPVRFVEKVKHWQFEVGDTRHPMADLLLGPWIGPAPATDDDITQLRFFQSFFHVPIRTLVDTDMALSDLVWGGKAPEARRLMDIITWELERRLGEVGQELSDEACEMLRRALRERRPSRGCVPSFEASQLQEWRYTRHGLEYTLRDAGRVVISGVSRLEPLPPSISAGLMILHDLNVEVGNAPDQLFLDGLAGPTSTLEAIDHRSGSLTFTIPLHWLSLKWDRIGDALLFLRLWTITVERGTDDPRQLLHCWLRAWYAVEGRDHHLAFLPFDPSRIDALFATEGLGLIRSDGRDPAALERRLEVAAMLRPEQGWQEATVMPLLELPHVRRFLGRDDIASRMRELRARAMKAGTLIRLVSPRAWSQLRDQVSDTLDSMLQLAAASPDPVMEPPWAELATSLRGDDEIARATIDDLERTMKREVDALAKALARQTSTRARESGVWLGKAAKALESRWDLLRDALVPDAPSAFNQLEGADDADGAEGVLCPDLATLEVAGVIAPLDLPPMPELAAREGPATPPVVPPAQSP